MIGYITATIALVVIVGPKAVGNVLSGTHDYTDGFSVSYKKEGLKYKQEQYNK